MSYICEIPEFNAWLKKASPLEQFIYFTGETLTYSLMAKEIKKLTYNHALKGHIYLVQKKDVKETLFIAIKASKPPVYKLIPFTDEVLMEKGKAVYHGD